MKRILVIVFVLSYFAGYGEEDYLSKYTEGINELKRVLIENNVPEKWINEGIFDNKFTIYEEISKFYQNMAENRVKSGIKDNEWYFNHFGVKTKIKTGEMFINNNLPILKSIENRNGIHYELLCAILAIESNFADDRYKGKYYTFPALVSHYILMDKKKGFAVRELISLYQFSSKSGEGIYDFIGSFAGAVGWAQFIPTSLNKYYMPYNKGYDIFSVENSLSSIENYLYNHNLNKDTIKDEKYIYNAVYAYNHSDAYVKAVMTIYSDLKKIRNIE